MMAQIQMKMMVVNGDSNGIPHNLSKKQLLADAESELEHVRPQPVISTDQPSTVPLKLSRHS